MNPYKTFRLGHMIEHGTVLPTQEPYNIHHLDFYLTGNNMGFAEFVYYPKKETLIVDQFYPKANEYQFYSQGLPHKGFAALSLAKSLEAIQPYAKYSSVEHVEDSTSPTYSQFLARFGYNTNQRINLDDLKQTLDSYLEQLF